MYHARIPLILTLLALLVSCGDGEPGALDGGGPAADARHDGGGPAPDARPGGDGAPNLDPGPCSRPADPAHKYTPGVTYWGRNNYIEYVAGDLPIVISAPHGGYLKPGTIKDRTWGVLGQDTNSQEYTFELAHNIKLATGRYPHLIINRLHRIKYDANRELGEACQGDKVCEQAFNEFHQFINAAKSWVTRRCGRGHYFDFHTNAHSAAWVEVGVMLNASDLARSDAELNVSAYIDKSSLRVLARLPGRSFPAIVRGPWSLGGLMMSRGYKAVPSPSHPYPGTQGYFSGGYNTYRHGSRTGGVVDGTQVETYTKFIDTELGRDDYSLQLSRSIHDFVERHYQVKLADLTWKPAPYQRCSGARKLTLSGGQVTVQGSTAGATNEFGKLVTCGNSFPLDGPQVYYTVQLTPGARYELSLTPTFAARPYVFGDTCAASLISVQCSGQGVSAPLTEPNVTYKVSFTANSSGKQTIAVDSRDAAYHGSFTLKLRAL